MFDKKDKKKLTKKVKFTESKKYKSMNKDEIIRKVIEKEEMLKKLKDELSETKKVRRKNRGNLLNLPTKGL
ncbi:hypothetical protein B6228_02775 [Candidatus Atribacteria bacterium 4572_76]|nr:MAG: hypothetical protein B6228_02775 [Candidatus Atribacteria bacterium 4572_76]